MHTKSKAQCCIKHLNLPEKASGNWSDFLKAINPLV